MTNCLPTMWYQYLSSVWQYCKLSLNLSQPSLLLPLVKFFNASHPGTAHTHTHWRYFGTCNQVSQGNILQADSLGWLQRVCGVVLTCAHISPSICCLSMFPLLSTHTHSFPSAGRTPSSWLAYPSSRTTNCGEQTNKHDLKTFCTMNSQISPDLCLPWHDCYNQQRQPWDYTKITWDIIIKSVGKIRHWNIFWVYLQQPLWSPPCRGSHHRDATATWAPKPSPRSNLNAFLGTLDDTFGPYPR